jgi:hypothetical protein
MFGHGQVEGYTEKYGMEYRRAYWNEWPDGGLMHRHEREIFPLLHRRHIFAEVCDFLLYDFYAPEGHVNEDVFAYSNRCGDERGLVVYHNKFAHARGWVRTSAAYAVKTPEGKTLVQRTLGEGLGLHHDNNFYTIFRDAVTGLEFIRNSKDLCERGLYVELDAYKYQVFLDFREVCDNEWHHYGHLHAYLNGRGVPSVDAALREIFLRPIHNPFKELANAGQLRALIDARGTAPAVLLDEVDGKARWLLGEIKQFTGGQGDEQAIAGEIRAKCAALLLLSDAPDDDPAFWGTLLGWAFVHALGKAVTAEDYAEQSRSWIDEWLLGRILAGALQDLGLDEGAAWRAVGTIALLTTHQRWYQTAETPYQLLTAWLQDPEVQGFLQINRHQGVLWFNQESFDHLLRWMQAIAIAGLHADPSLTAEEITRRTLACTELLATLHHAEETSGYQVERLLEAAQEAVSV